MQRILLCWVFLMSPLSCAITAPAAPRRGCQDPSGNWCFGTMTMQVAPLHLHLHAEGSLLDNGDVLVQITEGSRTERALHRAVDSKTAYFGVTEDELRPGRIGSAPPGCDHHRRNVNPAPPARAVRPAFSRSRSRYCGSSAAPYRP